MDEVLNQKPMTTDEESDWSIEIYEGIYLPNKDAGLKENNKQRTAQEESDACHRLNTARTPHPFFQTYRTQAFELAQGEASVPPNKEDDGDLTQLDQRDTPKDTIQQTSPHPAAGFSMVATERPIDRSRPEPPPPRAFKLAKKVNINRAHSKKRAVRIPEESHESSRAVHLPIRKPNQSSSAVELALPFAARNLSCDKPSNDAKNSTTPTYSYLDYRNPPAAVLYTQCEDEANDLVQSLER